MTGKGVSVAASLNVLGGCWKQFSKLSFLFVGCAHVCLCVCLSAKFRSSVRAITHLVNEQFHDIPSEILRCGIIHNDSLSLSGISQTHLIKGHTTVLKYFKGLRLQNVLWEILPSYSWLVNESLCKTEGNSRWILRCYSPICVNNIYSRLLAQALYISAKQLVYLK